MNITEKLRGMAYASYLPCKMIFEKSGRIVNADGISLSPLSIVGANGSKWEYSIWPLKLLLYPISSITDEHAIEIAKIAVKTERSDFDSGNFIVKNGIESKRVESKSGYWCVEINNHICRLDPIVIVYYHQVPQNIGYGIMREITHKLCEFGYDLGYLHIDSLIWANIAVSLLDIDI